MPEKHVDITIGRGQDSEIKIPDKTVSKLHAIAEVHYYNEIYIIDKDSTNGTFLNGKQIRKARVNVTDQLSFGKYQIENESFYNDLFARYKSKKDDFSREFNHLLSQFDKYQKKLDRLQDNPKGPLFLKLGLLAFLIAILLLFHDKIDQRFFYPLVIGLSGITLLGGLFSNSRGKRNKKIAELKLKYKKVLRCPKCNSSFLNTHIVMVKNMEECPNDHCNAQFTAQNSIDT